MTRAYPEKYRMPDCKGHACQNLMISFCLLAKPWARVNGILLVCLFHALFFFPFKALPAPTTRAEPIRAIMHDPKAFTQGLFLDGNTLYESEGLYGRSRIVRRNFPQGTLISSMNFTPEYFGEGCALLGDSIFVLTWKENTAFILGPDLSFKRTVSYVGEGWGLTTDGKCLWRSDGSAVLTRHNPKDFSVIELVMVHDNGIPVPLLNELEWVNGWIYANIWKFNKIAVINPKNGEVVQWIDCSELVPLMYTGKNGEERAWKTGACLNGIAWRKETDTLLITGKLWPVLYEIRRPLIPHK